MFCSRCGAANPDTGAFCVGCGNALRKRTATGAAAPGFDPSGGPAETSGKAIASLICGLFFLVFPAAVAAIILGHLSVSEINKAAGRLTGRRMAVTGLVFGYAGVAFIPFILIIAAIAIPNLLRARMAANEASAVGSLRTIEAAAVSYPAAYGNGFPPSLASMGGADGERASCDHAKLIDSALASGRKDGYEFSYAATLPRGFVVASPQPAAVAKGCTMAGGPGFEIHADPVTRGSTGVRSFYSDGTGVIRVSSNGTATADSPPLE